MVFYLTLLPGPELMPSFDAPYVHTSWQVMWQGTKPLKKEEDTCCCCGGSAKKK